MSVDPGSKVPRGILQLPVCVTCSHDGSVALGRAHIQVPVFRRVLRRPVFVAVQRHDGLTVLNLTLTLTQTGRGKAVLGRVVDVSSRRARGPAHVGARGAVQNEVRLTSVCVRIREEVARKPGLQAPAEQPVEGASETHRKRRVQDKV